jgi:hypothetical protein
MTKIGPSVDNNGRRGFNSTYGLQSVLVVNGHIGTGIDAHAV